MLINFPTIRESVGDCEEAAEHADEERNFELKAANLHQAAIMRELLGNSQS